MRAWLEDFIAKSWINKDQLVELHLERSEVRDASERTRRRPSEAGTNCRAFGGALRATNDMQCDADRDCSRRSKSLCATEQVHNTPATVAAAVAATQFQQNRRIQKHQVDQRQQPAKKVRRGSSLYQELPSLYTSSIY